MKDIGNRGANRLIERMVRNDDIFCSLLFDHDNRTLRVVDFRGGNFQTKHAYLEKVLTTESMRKIFTLIERDDMHGWQRVGYQREGGIPGYYKRSDAYIMSRIYDPDYDGSKVMTDESPERKTFLTDVKTLGKEIAEGHITGIKGDIVSEAEAYELLVEEQKRIEIKADATRKAKGQTGGAKSRSRRGSATDLAPSLPLFRQFSREVEYYNFVVQNRRTRQVNVFGAEYQDCFGNAKVDVYFSPQTKPDQLLAREGLNAFVDRLALFGAVTIFALVRQGDIPMNALFMGSGFRNTGWLTRQTATSQGYADQILWTRKLV
ncbi:MAG: hypothetical protein PHU25_19425 [Deltaproteobacteria bacterium]|nr:hypothetical protein [Deltaproteobacteria bacterium]